MSKDLEEFIAKHAYQDGHDKFSCRCVSVEALTYWMAGHVRVPVEVIERALESVRKEFDKARNEAYPVCCGRGGSECCENPEPEWPEHAQATMDNLGPVEKTLAELLAASKGE